MSNDERNSSAREEKSAPDPKPIRLRPGRNQRQRSKLKQPDELQTAPPPPTPVAPPAPVAPPPPAQANDESVLRRLRLKRSGQMREDLFLPTDAEPKKKDDLY